jgi:hypothetical protein
VHDVTREVPQQIASGNPSRQRKTLLVGRPIDAARDLEPVPIEIGKTNAITDQSGCLRCEALTEIEGGIVAQPCCAKVAAGGARKG